MYFSQILVSAGPQTFLYPRPGTVVFRSRAPVSFGVLSNFFFFAPSPPLLPFARSLFLERLVLVFVQFSELRELLPQNGCFVLRVSPLPLFSFLLSSRRLGRPGLVPALSFFPLDSPLQSISRSWPFLSTVETVFSFHFRVPLPCRTPWSSIPETVVAKILRDRRPAEAEGRARCYLTLLILPYWLTCRIADHLRVVCDFPSKAKGPVCPLILSASRSTILLLLLFFCPFLPG